MSQNHVTAKGKCTYCGSSLKSVFNVKDGSTPHVKIIFTAVVGVELGSVD